MSKKISLNVEETKNTDLRAMPIDVTDDNNKQMGTIFIGLGSCKIFISNYQTGNNYVIDPSEIWDKLFPEEDNINNATT